MENVGTTARASVRDHHRGLGPEGKLWEIGKSCLDSPSGSAGAKRLSRVFSWIFCSFRASSSRLTNTRDWWNNQMITKPVLPVGESLTHRRGRIMMLLSEVLIVDKS